MAPPASGFGGQLQLLIEAGPLFGPVVLTHSRADRANCLWHRFTERLQPGIGCAGAREPRAYLQSVQIRDLDQAYEDGDFPPRRIVNVDANRVFRNSPWHQLERAHSDFWYEESIHLILGVANSTRGMR
jgi:hypothetical protein